MDVLMKPSSLITDQTERGSTSSILPLSAAHSSNTPLALSLVFLVPVLRFRISLFFAAPRSLEQTFYNVSLPARV